MDRFPNVRILLQLNVDRMQQRGEDPADFLLALYETFVGKEHDKNTVPLNFLEVKEDGSMVPTTPYKVLGIHGRDVFLHLGLYGRNMGGKARIKGSKQ